MSSKSKTLAVGDPRRASDARSAVRKMSDEQLVEHITWLALTYGKAGTPAPGMWIDKCGFRFCIITYEPGTQPKGK